MIGALRCRGPNGPHSLQRCKTVSGRGSRPRLHRLACRAASGDELVFAPDSGSGSGSGLGARRHALDLGMDPLAVGTQVYGPAERLVLDAQPAEAFFGVARTGVAHTDAGFVRQLHGVYGQALEPLSGQSSALLDLCSSWASHLPTGLRFGQVIGHGMNADELAANGALTSTFVQDLNERPSLPLPAASVDAVLVCNGLQYLVRPEWVAAEVARVLKPGGAVVAAFSDACWLERAAAGWLSRGPAERLQLVARLLEGAGLGVVESISRPSAAPGSDAFYAVVARKAPLEDAHGGQGAGAAAVTPPELWSPALQELDGWTGNSTAPPAGAAGPPPLALERWRDAYDMLVEDASEMGIPRSAIPPLPPNAGPEAILQARNHLQAMIASFLSAEL